MKYFVCYSDNNKIQIVSFDTLEEALNKKRDLYNKGYYSYVIHGDARLY